VAQPDRPKRRLPVLQNKDEDEGEERPAWHWVVLTAATTLLAWLLIAAVTNAVVRSASPQWALVANALALALSAGLAGALAGKFGTRAEVRHAALGGFLTAAFGCALTWRALSGSPATFAATLILASTIATAGAAIGFRVIRRRARA